MAVTTGPFPSKDTSPNEAVSDRKKWAVSDATERASEDQEVVVKSHRTQPPAASPEESSVV